METNRLVFYELDMRYFRDENNDGIGDIPGLISKLEYFSFLKVNSLMITNLLSSDDLSESKQSYFKISSALGTLEDFKILIAKAKSLGIKIFIDINIGSIYENNDWFNQISSETLVENEEYKNKEIKKHIFNTTEIRYSTEAQKFYEMNLESKEITLNWNSSKVLQNFLQVINFWHQEGVSGFVVKNFESLNNGWQKNGLSKETITDLSNFFKLIKEANKDVLIIGKSHLIKPHHALKYVKGPHQIFDYFYSTYISIHNLHPKFGIDKIGKKFNVKKFVSLLKPISNSEQILLSFDSSLVGRSISRWLTEGQYHEQASKCLALLNLSLSCSPLIYYGTEIGTKNLGIDNLDAISWDKTLEDRKYKALLAGISENDFIRAQILQNSINSHNLMPWNNLPNGGFSNSKHVISYVPNDFLEINVLNQYKNKQSTLNFYRLINDFIIKMYGKINLHRSVEISVQSKSVVVVKILLNDLQLTIFVNLSNSIRKIKFNSNNQEKSKVLFTTLTLNKHKNIPKKLNEYEGIVVSNIVV